MARKSWRQFGEEKAREREKIAEQERKREQEKKEREQKEQAQNTNGDIELNTTIAKQVAKMQYLIDFFKSPEDALLKYGGLRTGLYEIWYRQHFDELVNTVAKQTGADPEQIADIDKRTEEQAQLLVFEAARQEIARMDKFSKSVYMSAIEAISDAEEENRAKLTDTSVEVASTAALIFFALHGIDPRAAGRLNKTAAAEVIAIHNSLTDYLEKNPDSTLEQAIEKTAIEITKKPEEAKRIIFKVTNEINYPLDKPNHIIWDMVQDAVKSDGGQLKFDINTSKKGSNKDAVIIYGIDFSALENIQIARQLTLFDKRVLISAGALFNAGNEYITPTQIHYMMGNDRKPNARDIQKINDSLTKMGAARLYIDNTKETKAYKGYSHFKYDASLLPFERVSAYINGKFADSVIHLFREPPLLSFARERNQITTIDRKLLASPINKTDANLRIEDYLLDRIGRMKNHKNNAPRRMLFKTIYDHCRIATVKEKQRAPEKICRYLDYYKQCNWIKDYTKENDGITILL